MANPKFQSRKEAETPHARLTEPSVHGDDLAIEKAVRPTRFNEFVGQRALME
ncbi:MAG: hypothetical protein GF341_10420, partial [candidate division Zixibacteria bacterium]|nr:hypothetical protein [candidate division Zixibacteria bacterium]